MQPESRADGHDTLIYNNHPDGHDTPICDNRADGRDTFIYDSNHRDTLLGGLWLTEGVTNANLYYMVEIICVFTDTFDIHDNNEQLVERDEKPLQPGNYFIVTNGSITLTEEAPLLRALSLHSGPRIEAFRDAVRERDRRCVISGMRVLRPDLGRWTCFEVAHIFPLAYEDHWNKSNYSRWITIPPANESDGTIHSVQNGILLSANMHALFDAYHISINPDDNYKIIGFGPEVTYEKDIAGRRLDQTFLNNPLRPTDQLLRWHFRQAVLVNVKGLGEPYLENDFPSGSDIMAEIMDGSKAAERMEYELFSRFNAARPCA
ncbi:HNH endonuclease-domain-containing protein [Tuber borchii]|uniref:HNH endonuclease-domain-containing protein n=1 Tax=Tuber borchii TaxID=42251 RepID=A0A2T6ZEA8_TUBBO|nr:HNH endonuclease-domain-containing protein [Tuber borchii]